MLTKKHQKTSFNFYCKKCDFEFCKKGDYNRHLLTRKHNNVDIMLTNVDNITSKKHHTCLCGKEYQYRQSLSIHRKKCNKVIEINQNTETVTQTSSDNIELLSFLKNKYLKIKN